MIERFAPHQREEFQQHDACQQPDRQVQNHGMKAAAELEQRLTARQHKWGSRGHYAMISGRNLPKTSVNR